MRGVHVRTTLTAVVHKFYFPTTGKHRPERRIKPATTATRCPCDFSLSVLVITISSYHRKRRRARTRGFRSKTKWRRIERSARFVVFQFPKKNVDTILLWWRRRGNRRTMTVFSGKKRTRHVGRYRVDISGNRGDNTRIIHGGRKKKVEGIHRGRAQQKRPGNTFLGAARDI